MVHLRQLKGAVAPGVDRASAELILIHQADVLEDVPLQVVGLKHHLMLIGLSDLALGGRTAQVTATAAQLMAAERGIHAALSHIAGLDLEEVVFLLRPPGEAVAGLHVDLIFERLDAQQHVDPQDLVVREEVLPARAPEPQVAVEPAADAAVQLNATTA